MACFKSSLLSSCVGDARQFFSIFVALYIAFIPSCHARQVYDCFAKHTLILKDGIVTESKAFSDLVLRFDMDSGEYGGYAWDKGKLTIIQTSAANGDFIAYNSEPKAQYNNVKYLSMEGVNTLEKPHFVLSTVNRIFVGECEPPFDGSQKK